MTYPAPSDEGAVAAFGGDWGREENGLSLRLAPMGEPPPSSEGGSMRIVPVARDVSCGRHLPCRKGESCRSVSYYVNKKLPIFHGFLLQRNGCYGKL